MSHGTFLETTAVQSSVGTPRMRHIGIPDGDNAHIPFALCGFKFPIILDYDAAKDRGPVSTADCVVCRDLFVTYGGVL